MTASRRDAGRGGRIPEIRVYPIMTTKYSGAVMFAMLLCLSAVAAVVVSVGLGVARRIDELPRACVSRGTRA